MASILPGRLHRKTFSATMRCGARSLGIRAVYREEQEEHEHIHGQQNKLTKAVHTAQPGRSEMSTVAAVHTRVSTDPIYQSYQILHVTFTIAPILAGFDKFLHLLTNWDKYLAPAFARLSPIPPHSLMLVIGMVEIIAGVVVAFKPRI